MTDIASLGIRVTSTGVKEATRDLDKLGDESKQTSKEVSSLGKTLAGLGVGFIAGRVIGAGISRIIENTIEAEKVQAQLQAVLKSTGGVAGVTASQLNAMADSLAQVTVFDDEAISGAQALLLTFTKIGKDVFPDATEAVLNMSQALGQDLKSSATQLGKALNDPIKGITALSRVGVAFSQSQKDVIKNLVETGRVADAQRIILGELTTEFGGSARAARDTLGGALQGLKNDFDNLLEGDGKGVEGTTQAIKDLSATLNSAEVKAGFQAIIRGIAEVTRLAALAIPTIVQLKTQFQDLYAQDGQKSYLGLLQKEATLRDEIDAIQRRGGNRVAGFSPNAGRTVADLQAELAATNALSQAARGLDSARSRAASSGGSSGSGNGRGRGVRGTDRPKIDVGEGDEEKKSKGRKAALSDEQKAANQLAEGYKRMNAQLKEQVALYGQTGEEVRLRYQLENGELAKLTAAEKDSLIVQARRLDQLAAEDEARQKAIRLEEEQTDAIKEHEKAVKDLLDDIAFETKLIGLSNVEREKAIALRYAEVDAASAQGRAISAAVEERDATEARARGIEDLRQRGEDLFVDLTDGVGTWREAFDDAIDSFRMQMLQLIAEQLFKKLIPDSLATSTGGGDGFGSIVGALLGAFGGGRAIGGPVKAGKLYEVGEKGPELLRANGRNYMIPGRDGKVAQGGGNKSQVNNISVNVPPSTSRATADQTASAVAAALDRVNRRNR